MQMSGRPLAFNETNATARPSGETLRGPWPPTVSEVGKASVHPSGGLMKKRAVRASGGRERKLAARANATATDKAATAHASPPLRRDVPRGSTAPAAIDADSATHLT